MFYDFLIIFKKKMKNKSMKPIEGFLCLEL